jgi:hypothetical protein
MSRTSAFGTDWPVESTTRPLMVPLSVCANADATQRRNAAGKDRRRCFIVISLSRGEILLTRQIVGAYFSDIVRRLIECSI